MFAVGRMDSQQGQEATNPILHIPMKRDRLGVVCDVSYTAMCFDRGMAMRTLRLICPDPGHALGLGIVSSPALTSSGGRGRFQKDENWPNRKACHEPIDQQRCAFQNSDQRRRKTDNLVQLTAQCVAACGDKNPWRVPCRIGNADRRAQYTRRRAKGQSGVWLTRFCKAFPTIATSFRVRQGQGRSMFA